MSFVATTALTEFWAKCKGTFTTLDSVYPVGSIYMSVNSTDPGTLFGGTWVRLTDTFLLAAGTTYDADDGTHTTATGGAAEVQLSESETPVRNHKQPERTPRPGMPRFPHRLPEAR